MPRRTKEELATTNIRIEKDHAGRDVWVLRKQWPDKTTFRRRMPYERAVKLQRDMDSAIDRGTWRELQKSLSRELNVGSGPVDPNMTVAAFVEIYFDEYCLSKHAGDKGTLGYKRQHLSKIRELVGDKKLTAFTLDDAEYVKRVRQKTVSNNTVTKTMSTLQNMFRFAVETKKFLAVNPVAGYERLKINEKKRQDILPEEAKVLLAEVFRIDPLVGAFIGICGEEALRPWKEGLNLKRRLFDMRPRVTPEDERWLTIEPSKHSEKGRTLPLSDAAIEYARMLPVVFGSEFLFVDVRTGLPPTRDYIDGVLDKAQAACGITWPTAYDLTRHFRATTWGSTGAPAINVMKWMGHKKIETTMRYMRPVNDQQNFREAKERELQRLREAERKENDGGDIPESA